MIAYMKPNLTSFFPRAQKENGMREIFRFVLAVSVLTAALGLIRGAQDCREGGFRAHLVY